MPSRVQFLREIRALARARSLFVKVDTKKGKGSHFRVRVGQRVTTIPEKLSPLMTRIIRKQLGLD
ncbi:hypothetical protein D1F64_01140 [Breoghania sp. L-A4]|nr:hypothetical protein D1F64_01140 [Breoghania sp. L-A4]